MADRQFTEDTLVIATHNAGKMREIGALFAGFDIDILINKVMKNCSLMTNGIIFFPKYSGISIIYLEQKDVLQKNKVTISESNTYKTEKYDKPKSELSSNNS